ncbi:MAG: aminopeptidase P family protein [Lachnospiraceae bacterium]|nr:aminopeptidase P family protein [Lachnospiraceae bacterium]
MINSRIAALRKKMEICNVHYVIIPTGDYHNSEYVSDFFRVREFFTGFTGSNGTLVVTREEALLWTDGRYFIQAELELKGSEIILCKMGEEDVPTIQEYLALNYKQDEVMGVDGRVITTSFAKKIKDAVFDATGFYCEFNDGFIPYEGIWDNQPKLPANPVFVLNGDLSGVDYKEKVLKLRKKMKALKADAIWLSKLDDIMWLFNIRGNDVECNPVALSYCYIDEDISTLMIQKDAVTEELSDYCEKNQIELIDYSECDFICSTPENKTILIDPQYASYRHKSILEKKNTIIELPSPIIAMKAVKNPVEISRMREVYLKDSAALTKFIYWIKNVKDKAVLNEYEVGRMVDCYRMEVDGFIELSFPTICAYGPNGAMMHYEATKESNSKLDNKGFLLVDSGGQYYGGTTDVTRTIVLGELTDEMKRHYTLVLKGMLNLSMVKFMYGCSGKNLDILARGPLWKEGIDYKCGTGHGVGYMLNVHEGPQSFRFKTLPGIDDSVLEEGMVITNEPGVYIEGSHGIRIENVLLCHKDIKNSDGQFMSFETLTKVPIDKEAVLVDLLAKDEREFLNKYHEDVYRDISPFLSEEEKSWLRSATTPL